MTERNANLAQVTAWLRAHPAARLVGIAGIPGAGKSTLAEKLSGQFPGSAAIPMDGYHFPLDALDAEGKRRRGSPPTFDSASFRKDIERLKRTGGGVFPGWSHARQDPQPGALKVGSDATRIFVEGLYVLLDSWRTFPLFDLTIFADCDLEIAMQRVEDRLVQTGVYGSDRTAMRRRVDANDRLNAEIVLADGCRERADFVLSTG